MTASSFILTIGHLKQINTYYFITLILGIIFLLNQIDELFSLLTISGCEELSMILLCLYTHLSHLVLSIVLFFKYLIRSTSLLNDNQSLFVSTYWHLVEVVWIIILLTLAEF